MFARILLIILMDGIIVILSVSFFVNHVFAEEEQETNKIRDIINEKGPYSTQ